MVRRSPGSTTNAAYFDLSRLDGEHGRRRRRKLCLPFCQSLGEGVPLFVPVDYMRYTIRKSISTDDTRECVQDVP